MTNATPDIGPNTQATTAGARFLGKFTVLKGAARELWITFAVKLLVIAAYALTNSTLVLWLSSDLGYSDQNALRLVAAWSLLMTVITLLVSVGAKPTAPLGSPPSAKSAALAGLAPLPATAQLALVDPLVSPVRVTVNVNGVLPAFPSGLFASVA